MSAGLNAILSHDAGAAFFTADLHVHSHGGSLDVKDTSASVEALIDAAVDHGINILSITDHNNDKNISKALHYAGKYQGQLLMIPGVEVSTAHGHLLVYCDPASPELITTLLARIDLVGPKGGRDTRTARSMADVITEAHRLGAICIAAHVDREKTGFEALASGYPGWKHDIITSAGLYGLDFDDSANLTWFSPEDGPGDAAGQRRVILRAREGVPGIAARRLAAIQNSDAHTLADFIAKRPLTRFKMTELDYSGFRTALIDSEARVRAVATVPPATPRVLGFAIGGGFADGQICRLSPNLNCFIGGRGAGKSTAVQSLAYGLGLNRDFADGDNCPDIVEVFCEDANGTRFRFVRQRGGDAEVVAWDALGNEIEAPTASFRVEFFRQGDLAEVSRDPLKNPSLLQDFLDRHLALDDLVDVEQSLIADLAHNSGQLRPLESGAAQLVQKQARVAEVDKKLRIAEEGKLKDVASAQTRVAAEKAFAQVVSNVALEYERTQTLATLKKDYATLRGASGEFTSNATVSNAFAQVQAIMNATNHWLAEEAKKITAELQASALKLREALKPIPAQHARWNERISQKLAELRAQGLSGNLTQLTQLVQERNQLGADVARLTEQHTALEQARALRRDLLGALADTRRQKSDRRRAQLQTINVSFKRTLGDYTVVVLYQPAGITGAFEALVNQVMHGSWMPETEINKLCRATTPPHLAELVAADGHAALAILGGIGVKWATELIKRFKPLEHLHRLEVCDKPPCPIIKVVTKSGKQIPVHQLSDGQKHTIFLTMAMLAESNDPLIIDQPEDDLDNAFIFSTVVKTLRHIKERRQVIIVTHNANIAVLGDSELLYAMRRNGETGEVFERGSIDKPTTKIAVQDVLEGGAEAFLRRKAIYNV
jgi:hypothetical protein